MNQNISDFNLKTIYTCNFCTTVFIVLPQSLRDWLWVMEKKKKKKYENEVKKGVDPNSKPHPKCYSKVQIPLLIPFL